jgi:CPA1 family monovalent cation:H+ antiporter
MRYRSEFGPGEIYTLQSSVDVEGSQRRALSRAFPGRTLFGSDVSYASLSQMLKSGAEVRTTKLSATFDFDDFVRKHWKRAVPLFAITPKGQLRVFVAASELVPEEGWRVVALVEPAPEAEEGAG